MGSIITNRKRPATPRSRTTSGDTVNLGGPKTKKKSRTQWTETRSGSRLEFAVEQVHDLVGRRLYDAHERAVVERRSRVWVSLDDLVLTVDGLEAARTLAGRGGMEDRADLDLAADLLWRAMSQAARHRVTGVDFSLAEIALVIAGIAAAQKIVPDFAVIVAASVEAVE